MTPLLRALALAVPTLVMAAAPSTAPAAAQEMDPGTRAALKQVLAGDQRSEANKARDRYRHPEETLAFFGVRQGMTVVEIWPGAGWYTEVLAPLLKGNGTFYAAGIDRSVTSEGGQRQVKAYADKLAARPDLYGEVKVTELSPTKLEIAPPGSADMVLTFRNVHNFQMMGWEDQAFQAFYKALKPGGILGIEDHRAPADKPQDPKAPSGYLREDYVIRLAEKAGFKLVGKSEINANPKDTKDYPGGVWTLPPTLRLGDQDRAKYQAIGESDRMTLKFIKPKA
jgi:predicted methyltransferase